MELLYVARMSPGRRENTQWVTRGGSLARIDGSDGKRTIGLVSGNTLKSLYEVLHPHKK